MNRKRNRCDGRTQPCHGKISHLTYFTVLVTALKHAQTTMSVFAHGKSFVMHRPPAEPKLHQWHPSDAVFATQPASFVSVKQAKGIGPGAGPGPGDGPGAGPGARLLHLALAEEPVVWSSMPHAIATLHAEVTLLTPVWV